MCGPIKLFESLYVILGYTRKLYSYIFPPNLFFHVFPMLVMVWYTIHKFIFVLLFVAFSVYKKDLDKEMKGETSGDFAKLVLALLNVILSVCYLYLPSFILLKPFTLSRVRNMKHLENMNRSFSTLWHYVAFVNVASTLKWPEVFLLLCPNRKKTFLVWFKEILRYCLVDAFYTHSLIFIDFSLSNESEEWWRW